MTYSYFKYSISAVSKPVTVEKETFFTSTPTQPLKAKPSPPTTTTFNPAAANSAAHGSSDPVACNEFTLPVSIVNMCTI